MLYNREVLLSAYSDRTAENAAARKKDLFSVKQPKSQEGYVRQSA